MLGQYMNSIGYGAYDTAFRGLGGSLPAPALRAIFAPEKVKEGDFPLASEFVGATLSRGFQIVKEGEKYFIVPKGADSLAAIAGSVTGGGVVGKLVSAVAEAATGVVGDLTGVRVELTDKSQSISQSTAAGGVLVYKPAGINMMLVAGIAVAVVIGLLIFMKR